MLDASILTMLKISEMASEDEPSLTEAVVTCEGNLHDPDFSTRFHALVDKLKALLHTSKSGRVVLYSERDSLI